MREVLEPVAALFYTVFMAKKFPEGKFNIIEHEKIYGGPHSTIESVSLSSGKHSSKLLRKKFTGYDTEFMQGLQWHTSLKEHGYPVFPTWRYDEENKTEYITDLRQGGTHRVIDFCSGKENYEKARVSNLEELRADVEKLLQKSADDGLVINEPNIFFDVDLRTGITKVLLGDLRELGYESSGSEDCVPTRDQVFTNNKAVLDEHMSRLRSIME